VCLSERTSLGTEYLENGWTRFGSNEPPIANRIWRIEMSRLRRRHVILKGQGRDPNMYGALPSTLPVRNGL